MACCEGAGRSLEPRPIGRSRAAHLRRARSGNAARVGRPGGEDPPELEACGHSGQWPHLRRDERGRYLPGPIDLELSRHWKRENSGCGLRQCDEAPNVLDRRRSGGCPVTADVGNGWKADSGGSRLTVCFRSVAQAAGRLAWAHSGCCATCPRRLHSRTCRTGRAACITEPGHRAFVALERLAAGEHILVRGRLSRRDGHLSFRYGSGDVLALAS